jgi:hypothetical protein
VIIIDIALLKWSDFILLGLMKVTATKFSHQIRRVKHAAVRRLGQRCTLVFV